MTTQSSSSLVGDGRTLATPSSSRPALEASAAPLWKVLAPLCAMVFLEFLAMGLPLPVLPVHVHATLGLGSWVVGLAIGAQAWATLLTRHASGSWSDQRGPRSATLVGLALSSLAGVTYALSAAVAAPAASLVVLLAARLVLGLGESLVVTGALSWGIALAGRERSGVVMSWVGIAMYGALAGGAPLGLLIAGRHGFVGVAWASAAAPLGAMGALWLVRAVTPMGGARLAFHRVLGAIWLPGLGLTLSALGFGAIAAFATLRFGAEGWPSAALAMTAFGAAYVLARVFFGGLPDRFGGARIAALSAAVAALGQLGMWLARSAELAIAAAALTGLGFSLAFPSFGVEAMRRVPAQSRGAALGAYSACFDLTMGVGVPLLGLVVGATSFRAAFAVSAVSAALSVAIALVLVRRAPPRSA